MTITTGEWYVYVLRCNDNSLYCGITNDLAKRLSAHMAGKGAKYTRGRGPFEVLATWVEPNKSEALRHEYRFKRLSRGQKLEQICLLKAKAVG